MQQEWSLVEAGNYSAAEKNLTEYLKGHADSADAHFLLGYVYYREQKAKESLAEYTAGARLRKPAANDLAVVAMDYILLGDFRDADRWLTMAVQWNPNEALYWYYLGRTKNNEFQFKEAVNAFEQCLKLHPKDVRAEYNLGLAYAGLERDADAAQAYGTAIEWQEQEARRDPQPYLDMGKLLLEQEHPEQAIPYLRQALALDDKNPTFHEQLGRAYERTGKLNLAQAEISRAIALAPEVSSLHYELGRIYSREGNSAQAKQEFDRCSALNAVHRNGQVPTPNPISNE